MLLPNSGMSATMNAVDIKDVYKRQVEYLGANKDFKPMSMNMATHAMD